LNGKVERKLSESYLCTYINGIVRALQTLVRQHTG